MDIKGTQLVECSNKVCINDQQDFLIISYHFI